MGSGLMGNLCFGDWQYKEVGGNVDHSVRQSQERKVQKRWKGDIVSLPWKFLRNRR